MKDLKEKIIKAGLAVIREHGFAGFTQPRVAALAGVRQSHLTYYFPTRVDLLAAVGLAAIDNQLGAIDTMLDGSSIRKASAAIAGISVRHENTRVLMALAQAADQEPPLRALFLELADGIILRAGKLLTGLNIEPKDEHRYLIHALSVGLAVIDLATARPDGEARATKVLETVLTQLAEPKGNSKS